MKMKKIKCSKYLNASPVMKYDAIIEPKEDIQQGSDTNTAIEPVIEHKPKIREKMIHTNCREKKYVPFPYFYGKKPQEKIELDEEQIMRLIENTQESIPEDPEEPIMDEITEPVFEDITEPIFEEITEPKNEESPDEVQEGTMGSNHEKSPFEISNPIWDMTMDYMKKFKMPTFQDLGVDTNTVTSFWTNILQEFMKGNILSITIEDETDNNNEKG